MKDVLISGRRIVGELRVFFGCLVFALGLNVFAIIKYQTPWKELLTTLPVTLAVAIVVYVSIGIVRLFLWGIARLFRRNSG